MPATALLRICVFHTCGSGRAHACRRLSPAAVEQGLQEIWTVMGRAVARGSRGDFVRIPPVIFDIWHLTFDILQVRRSPTWLPPQFYCSRSLI